MTTATRASIWYQQQRPTQWTAGLSFISPMYEKRKIHLQLVVVVLITSQEHFIAGILLSPNAVLQFAIKDLSLGFSVYYIQCSVHH